MIKQISKRARSSTTNYSMSNVSEPFTLQLLPVFPLSRSCSIVVSNDFMPLLLLQGREEKSGWKLEENWKPCCFVK